MTSYWNYYTFFAFIGISRGRVLFPLGGVPNIRLQAELYMRITTFVLCLLFLVQGGRIEAGERAFSWTQAPGRNDYIGLRFNPYNLGKYLEQCELNRPEILNEVKRALDEGNYYRKSTKDQKGRNARITINVNPDYQLRIVTWRNEPCDNCNGSGRKELPFGKATGGVSAGLNCVECKGKGYFEGKTTERYFIISPEDFENPREGRRILANRAYQGAPRGADTWVERLVSGDPAERLAACEWLDENYVKIGAQFTDIVPMLRKARYHEANEKKKIMVWQFWAGKDLPKGKDRAYYRIYANSKTGKITRKGFYPQ